MPFFIITFLISTLLSAANYDEDVLGIYSKIIPRLVLMSSQKDKLEENINICLVNDEIDRLTMDSVASKVQESYPSGIKKYSVDIHRANYENLSNCKESEIIFFLFATDKNVKQLTIFSKKHQILTISYHQERLQDDVDISLDIGRKIVPYLNMKSIQKKNIQLNNTLLRISKIYSKGDE